MDSPEGIQVKRIILKHNGKHRVDALTLYIHYHIVIVYTFSLPRGENLVWRIFLFSFYFAHFLLADRKYNVQGIYCKRPTATFLLVAAFLAPCPPPPPAS
jgi:hypothetical protein